MNVHAYACLVFFVFVVEAVGEAFYEANQNSSLSEAVKFPPVKIEFSIYEIDENGATLSEKSDFDFPAKSRFINTVYTVNDTMYVGYFSLDVVEVFAFKKVPCLFAFKEEKIHSLSKESLISLLGPPINRDDFGRFYWGFYTVRGREVKFQWVHYAPKRKGVYKVSEIHVGYSDTITFK